MTTPNAPNTPMPDTKPDTKAKLDELRARKAEKQAARAAAQEARELETLQLEEKLEAELGGPRGLAFQIVDAEGEPLIVVKPGAAVLIKRLRESKGTFDDVQGFVTPCVHSPDKATFAAIIERKALVLIRCSDALVALYRGEAESESKK
jgi:hypothetical protein